ncbi:MAG: hypothetical protein R6W78_12970 [Bacteroidales bacterium]
MKMKKNEIQKDIIKMLSDKKECAFGTLVKELNYSYNEILKNVIELKRKGIIIKPDKHGGNYMLPKYQVISTEN